MRRQDTKTKKLVLCAIFSALSVMILFLGSVVDVLDLTAAMLASTLCAVVLIEAGQLWPWLTYAVTAAASLIMLPNKLPAVIFLLTGYYPIIKQKLERLNKIVSWVLKILIFNVLLTVFLLVCSSFFPSADLVLFAGLSKEINALIGYAAGNVVFVLYDIALSRLITYYVFVLRDRLRIGKK